jgi:argininosuccinate lyase
MSTVLWAGRLEEKPEAEAFAFQASIGIDQAMAEDDIAGSRAHAAMIGKAGIISADVAEKLDGCLANIA